jgi:hypothetical protein
VNAYHLFGDGTFVRAAGDTRHITTHLRRVSRVSRISRVGGLVRRSIEITEEGKRAIKRE